MKLFTIMQWRSKQHPKSRNHKKNLLSLMTQKVIILYFKKTTNSKGTEFDKVGKKVTIYMTENRGLMILTYTYTQ